MIHRFPSIEPVCFLHNNYGALSNSSLHWLVSRNHSVSSLASNYLDLFIVSFDIVTEELRDMPLPDRANIDVVILMYYLWMKLEGLFV